MTYDEPEVFSLNVRQALPSDRQAVARLVLLAIQDIAYQLTGEAEEASALAQLERYYLAPGNRFSADRYLVLTAEDGAVAGMILCYDGAHAEALYRPVLDHVRQRLGAAPAMDVEADDDEFYIDALAVFPAYEGRGYAKALMAEAETWALREGRRKIALNVDLDKEKVYAIYLKRGYEEDKQIEINGHAFRHMVKSL
ncbi:GNAT family N-acetyltransferase [Cohnella nanjingensis]|uniref:GNAT family N-acetyltransferase n=1 Tax=Cohnella nanjingensis TaxID=1387779 RepID=A0A7X0VH58_9BACL|nr:GNAT family N-acetyltransferase [Cohnella nanjingensis]MBB6672309.1 GNAT family N-acetyltransferase [Cohnella nanjingensis]